MDTNGKTSKVNEYNVTT